MANRTYAVLEKDVARFTGGEAIDRAQYVAAQALRQAIARANRRGVCWWLFDTADVTLQAAVQEYAAPSSADTPIKPFNVHIASALLDPTGTHGTTPVRYLPESDWFRLNLSRPDHSGMPITFTYRERDNKYVLDKLPGATYAGRILRSAFFKKLVVPADNQTLGIVDEAEDWIEAEAVWRMKRLIKSRGGWAEDKALADETELQLLAARRSIDVRSLGFVFRY